jgi:hypothetical protein
MMSYEEKLGDAKPKISIDATFARYRDNLVRYQTETNNDGKKRGHTQNKQLDGKDEGRARNGSVIASKEGGNRFIAPKSVMPIIDKVNSGGQTESQLLHVDRKPQRTRSGHRSAKEVVDYWSV